MLPAWAQQAVAEFTGRFPREWRFELREVPAATRTKSSDAARAKGQEGERLLRAAGEAAIVALDERGATLATADWAKALQQWQRDGRDRALLIGGADGLSPECLARADARWSL